MRVLRRFLSPAPYSSSVKRSRPMAEALAAEIHVAQEAVTKQADTVRSLKADVKAGKIEKVRAASWMSHDKSSDDVFC